MILADDVWDEDSAYVEMLANEGQRLREKSEKAAAAGGDYSDDEEEEDEIEEELGYISPLDNVDPYVTFKQALTGKLLCHIIPDSNADPLLQPSR